MSTFKLRLESGHPILIGLLVFVFVSGQAIPGTFAQKKEETTITSETMTVQGKSKQTIFEGTVVFKKGNFIMRSDHMVVTFKKDAQDGSQEKEGGPSGQVDHIEANGKVVIEKSDGKATCGHALYDKDEEKLVLTESPVAWQGGTKVEGSQMTMFLKENRSIVEGGSRVVILEE